MKNLALHLISMWTVCSSALGTTNSIYAWRTLKGHPGGVGNVDGAGAAGRFWYPTGVAVDSLGNIYLADTYNNTIRKVTGGGVVTTLAGSPGQFGGEDGVGSAARFSFPADVAVDATGNLYVADTDNCTIRMVTTNGVVTTLAGSAGQPGTADGTNGTARFAYPTGITVDSLGNIYVADSDNATIRKVTSAGVVTTIAGTPGQYGNADGVGSSAQFFYPSGLAVDSSSNLFVADMNNQTIRRITSAGQVATLAGSVADPGSDDGTNGSARFYYPSGVAVDHQGNVYVADSFNSTVRKITSAGVVTTLAGSPEETGSADGDGDAARFSYPAGLAVDGAGNLYVADTYNSTLRKVTGGGTVTTLAGSLDKSGKTDASGSMARFRNPCGVVLDGAGSLYVADTYNHTVRKITFGGVVTTLAGVAGQPGSTNGPANNARFNAPYSIAADSSGNVYVADTSNHTIRKVTPGGLVSTLAGNPGQPGSADGTNGTARFNSPAGLAADAAGNLYVGDLNNHIVRKVTSAGVVTTLAGMAGQAGSSNGIGSSARFSGPFGVAVDSGGNVYVSDSGNHTIRKVASDGAVTTLAGSPGQSGSADGTNSNARFFSPAGVTLDSGGNLYVADLANHLIRKVTGAGVVTTLAGSAGQPGNANGTGSAARFFFPIGVTSDSSGNLFVADFQNSTIRKVTSAGVVTTFAGSAGQPGDADVDSGAVRFFGPSAVTVDDVGTLFVADTYNHTVRKFTSDGAVRTVGGSPGQSGTNDGVANSRFWHPLGLDVDTAGNVYVADTFNNTIRKIDPYDVVTTFAGSGSEAGSADGTGGAARFSSPSGLTLDGANNIFVTDTINATVRKITSAGVVTTFAGNPGVEGSADGTGSEARFKSPHGIATDSAGNLYVADSGNSTVRKVTSGGVVTTLAGSPGQSGSADGTGAGARFDYPFGVAVDAEGNVFVADSGNSTIRRITSGGVVTTIGGTAGMIGGADGIGKSAIFAWPAGVAVDQVGRLYVADTGNNRISRGLPLPLLNIARAGAAVKVSWPSPSAGFALQQSFDPANPLGWYASAYAVNDDGTNRSVVLTTPAGNQFFRLIAD